MDTIPRFSGSEPKLFLRKFEAAMLMLKEDVDERKAIYLATAMDPDTAADRWLKSVPSGLRGNYPLMVDSFKKKFCKDEMDTEKGMIALNRLSEMKLADEDIGVVRDGKSRNRKYVEEVEKLLTKIPKDTTETSKAVALLANMGAHTRRLIQNRRLYKFDEIMDFVRDMGEMDVDEVRRNVMIDRGSGWRNSYTFSPQTSPQQYRPQQPLRSFNSSYQQRQPQYSQQATYSGSTSFDDQNIPPEESRGRMNKGSVAPDQQVRIDSWMKAHPGVSDPPAESNFPLTPGRLPAGNSECYRCGQRGHRSRDCTGNPLPQMEQRYRYNVSSQKIADRSFSFGTGANAAAPIRSIAYREPEYRDMDEDYEYGLSSVPSWELQESGRGWLDSENDYRLGQ